MIKVLKKYLFVMAVIFSVTLVSACSQVENKQIKEETNQSTATTETEKAVAESEALEQEKDTKDLDASMYLKTWFGIDINENILKKDTFLAELSKLIGDNEITIDGELNWNQLINIAVKASDYEELALSYTPEKTEKRFEKYDLEYNKEDEDQAYIATALDVSLIDKSQANSAIKQEALSEKDIESVFMSIANANGDGRNYLGMSDDKDIYSKIDAAWNSFILFDDGTLNEIGKNAVINNITTGYGLKSSVYSARFIPELTLQYGHSDIKHAHQLIGLLNSEDIRAKVQLEPKISIYQYLLEWGTPPEKTPTYEVKQFDDNYLVYAVEYDLELEFDNFDDMKRFDSIINEYAKKNEGNEDAIGLIYASWWQPLYTTTRTDMPKESYHEIYDCVIENGVYSIHPFALAEDKDKVIQELGKISNGLEVMPQRRYCNTAFYNYMSGSDYQ